jgi:hypothetical protein
VPGSSTSTYKKTQKAARDGAAKWTEEHLPDDPIGQLSKADVKLMFAQSVVPLVIRKTGTLKPWAKPSVSDVQAIVDEAYGAGIFTVRADDVWMGLVSVPCPFPISAEEHGGL